MYTRKLLSLTLSLLLASASLTAQGGGKTYGGYYGNRWSQPRNNYQPSYNNISGPVKSFSRAYGPVTSFGLRNYYGNRSNDLYNRRYSYDENFNSYLRNRAIREQNSRKYENQFGYTYDSRSGKKNHKRGNRDGYKDPRRSVPGGFSSFGNTD